MYSKRQIKLIENWEEQSWSINFQAEIIEKKKTPGVTNISTAM